MHTALRRLQRCESNLLSKNSRREGLVAVFILVSLTLLLAVTACRGQNSSKHIPANHLPPDKELQRRLEQQRSAVRSGDSAGIIAASQKVASLALRQLAQWRLRQTAYPQAIALCRKALEMEENTETRTVLVDAETRREKLGEMLTQSADSVDPAASPDAAVVKRAMLTAAELRAELAQEKHLRHILSAIYNDWGATEARQEQFVPAIMHFQEAERWDTYTPGLMRNLGLASAEVGDHAEAARALTLAVKLDPKDTPSRSMLGVSLFAIGAYPEAAKSFKLIGDDAFANPEMIYAWAFSLSRTGQLKQARAVLEKMPDHQLSAEMLVLVGKVYQDIGDYTHALTCFQNASQQDPRIRKAHGAAGVALIHLNRPADAVPELEAELRMDGDDPDTQYQLAYSLLQLSRAEQAIPLLRSLVAAHPEHARARYQLGKLMLEAGQIEEAVQNLEAAAKLDPDRPYIHYQLQAAYRRVGRFPDAEHELDIYREIKNRDRQRISLKGQKNDQFEDNSN